MGVKVTLVTKDVVFVESCREILPEIFGGEWALTTDISRHRAQKGLIIWDFGPGKADIPQDLEASELRRYWFLLDRNDLPALHATVGATDLNVILKPITREALRAFLAEATLGCIQNDDLTGRAAELRVERDEMLQFLIQANLRLQENDQNRNNFLARSVHDFRAPLTALSGYCGLLLEEQFGQLTPEQRKIVGRMLHSATRLSRISTAMFQLTVPQKVDQQLNLEKADLQDCLNQAMHEVALILKEKRISIAAEIESPPDGLLFEQSQMEQTFVNLLENACKFTPREGTIKISGYPFFWERRAGQSAAADPTRERRIKQVDEFNSFRVDIRDSGPGIPAAQVLRIFEEYTSYGGGQDRSGGGLGLAICRMILSRHSGHIWAESHPSGALFSFVLPLHRTNTNLLVENDSIRPRSFAAAEG